MPLNDLESTINYWIALLDQYSFEQLTRKYQTNKWSLGQVFMHLIESSNFFLHNANHCLESMQNANEPLSESANNLFLKNELPNIDIEGPASNQATPQPKSIDAIREELTKTKALAISTMLRLQAGEQSGKIKHPGLGYFNATDWFRFTDIHLRHHMDQLPKIKAQLLDPV